VNHGRHDSLNRNAFQATIHCLTGCAIGEVLGLTIATAFDWSNLASIALAVALAFVFGYALSLRPIAAAGVPLRRALPFALAADTVSIATMEIVDNGIILAVPNAMEAGLLDWLFWWSLALGLAVAFVAAFPVNRALIARGQGHARVHQFHHEHG
jgi:putative flippase GtrA